MADWLGAAAGGFAISIGLIVAIGPQNAYVFRCGLKDDHALLAATTCFLADAILLSLGIFGAASVFALNPTLQQAMTWIGVAFITAYGLLSLRQAMREHPPVMRASGSTKAAGAAGVTATALALSWLNPHAWVDTQVLMGGIAAGYDPGPGRSGFGLGAILASGFWFYGLALGAKVLRPAFESERAWRTLDLVIGVTMLVIAALIARSTLL